MQSVPPIAELGPVWWQGLVRPSVDRLVDRIDPECPDGNHEREASGCPACQVHQRRARANDHGEKQGEQESRGLKAADHRAINYAAGSVELRGISVREVQLSGHAAAGARKS